MSLRGSGGDGQTGKRTNERKSPVFYRTSSPSGPLPCFLSLQFTVMQSRATGIADHILPLGDLVENMAVRNAKKFPRDEPAFNEKLL